MRSSLTTRLDDFLANLVPDRTRFTRSGVALLATIIVHLLLLLLLLLTHGPQVPKKEERDLATFSVMPDPARKAPGVKQKKVEKKAEAQAAPPHVVKPVVTPDPPLVAAPTIIPMSKDVFAASNISNLPSQGKSSGAGAGAGSAKVAGPGEGPGGVQLYEAEWYRRPTDMELAGFMPPNPPPNGWGLVACKTIENYHVENCQPLGESPLGSGFARAVRQAAWQFLVRPPRVDGKPQVGAWVRIRIDYTQHIVPADAGN
jgi:protein TonB